MKKFLTFLFLGLLLMVGAAYTVDNIMTEPVNSTINYDESFFYYSGLAKDTIGVGDSVYTFALRKKSLSKVTPYTYISLDSTGGTANVVTVTLESKVFEQENYTIRESKIWHDGGDTAIIFESDTAHISEYWRIKLSGANDTFKAKVLKLNFKFTQ